MYCNKMKEIMKELETKEITVNDAKEMVSVQMKFDFRKTLSQHRTPFNF